MVKEVGQVKQQVLDKIIQRIVAVAQPEKIILFGSAVRGEMGRNSDIDLLVVKSGIHRRRLAQAIYMNLIGVGQAVDVVVVTPEDIERYKDSFALVIEPALREGKVVYIRRAASLSDYAVETRYPGLAEPVIGQEYDEAVAIAEEVVCWAREIIERGTAGRLA